MVVVSGNTGSAPLIGSEVIRDRASDRSVCQPIFSGRIFVEGFHRLAGHTQTGQRKYRSACADLTLMRVIGLKCSLSNTWIGSAVLRPS